MTTSIRDCGRDRSRSPFVRAAARVLPLVAAVACVGAGATPAAAAEPWGFEQVTPPVKGGGAVSGADGFQAGPDGESFHYSASVPFGGVPTGSFPAYVRYLGARGPESWANWSLEVPFGGLSTIYNGSVIGTSANLKWALVASTVALAPGATDGGGNLYMRNARTGAMKLVATSDDPALAFTSTEAYTQSKFVADDGKSALFSILSLGVTVNDGDPEGALYSWTEAGGVEVASVLPDSLGGGADKNWAHLYIIPAGTRDALPEGDGLAHIYYATQNSDPFTPGTGPLWDRAGDDVRSVSYSRIPGDPATPVDIQSLSAVGRDGRYAVFTTQKGTRLTEDTPTTFGTFDRFIYRYDAEADPEDALTYIGADSDSGENARSGQAPLQMTQDGQTVAFQSLYALAEGGVDGQQNTYVWRDGTLRHVLTADQSSWPPSTSTQVFNWWRVLSTNGRYFAFSENSPALAQAAGYDEVGPDCLNLFAAAMPCEQVYVYDADEDVLSCASCPPDGAPMKDHASEPGGRAGNGYMRLNSRQPQNVANDGTVFFTSPNDLIAADFNGANDAYAFRDGELRLVGRAFQGTSSRFLDATPDGKTVFFATNDPIVGTDQDREVDVYMTREGAGYPYTAPVVTAPCEGSECRDSSAADTAGVVAGSLAFTGRGNVAKGPGRVRVSGVKAVIGSAGTLRVRVPGDGRVTTSGTGLRRAHATAGKAGTVKVAVRLSKSARRKLARGGRVRLRATVRYVPRTGSPQVAHVRLTFKTKGGR